MRKFSKYDVVDIVLVYLGLTFLLTLLVAVVGVGAFFAMKDDFYSKRGLAAAFQVVYLLALALVNYVLFFKRPAVIRLLMPGSEESELDVSDGLLILTRYSFWIRLAGILTVLKAGTQFFSQLSADLLVRRDFVTQGYRFTSTVTQFIAVGIGILIIWKADWIEARVRALGAPMHGAERSES